MGPQPVMNNKAKRDLNLQTIFELKNYFMQSRTHRERIPLNRFYCNYNHFLLYIIHSMFNNAFIVNLMN